MSNSSKLPDGGYDPTFASGLLLDGFDFDTEYGEGVESARKDPSPDLPRSQKGLAGLPDGFVTGHTASEDLVGSGEDMYEDGFGNLGGYLKAASPLVDFTWLESAVQDPDRLPVSPNDAVLQGLVEAWGTNRRTDGINLVPNVDFLPQPRSMSSRLPGDQYRDLVTSAMRRSAFGESIENIQRDIAAHLGDDLNNDTPQMKKLATALRAVKHEHGIAGKVYLRDAAFPALLTGKWDAEIKKRCASAPYWLTKPGSKLSAHDNYLGKKVVTEIPWRDAREHFRPILEASGKRLASGDPKKALLAAFAQEVVKVRPTPGVQVTALVDTVTGEHARKAFKDAPIAPQEVVSAPDNTLHLARQQVTRWVTTGLLTKEDGTKLLRSDLSPKSMVKVGAARIATYGKEVVYIGSGVGSHVPTPETTRTAAWAGEENRKLAAHVLSVAGRVVESYVTAGTLSRGDADRLLSMGLDPKEMVRVAAARAGDARRVMDGAGEIANLTAQRARDTILGFVSKGQLSQKEASRILASEATPNAKVKLAFTRVCANEKSYSDAVFTTHVDISTPAPMDAPVSKQSTALPLAVKRDYAGSEYRQNSKMTVTKHDLRWAKEQEDLLNRAKTARDLEAAGAKGKKAAAVLAKFVERGELTQKEASALLHSSLSPNEMVKVAVTRVQSRQKTYADKVYTENQKVAAPARGEEIPVQKLLRWASVQMNEGFAGNDLDHLIKARFSEPVIKGASERLVQIRRKHEGLAGHLYVDASAYASVTGTTGCDKGGLIHRANAIPSVLEMPRCGSCTSNVGGGCQKYGKPLIAEVPSDAGKFQREAIRLANAGDEERIASLFAPQYSEGEFGLQNDNLDFEYEDQPTNQALSDIVYGGMIVPTGDLNTFYTKGD